MIQVALDNDGCRRRPAGGVAGPVTFQISDTTGDQVSEVELLNNGLIVGEKENLFPGASGSFSVNLTARRLPAVLPGAATETTSFPSPHPPTASPQAATRRSPVEGAIHQAAADYRTYVQQEVSQLVANAQVLVKPPATATSPATPARQDLAGAHPLRARSSPRWPRASATWTPPN